MKNLEFYILEAGKTRKLKVAKILKYKYDGKTFEQILNEHANKLSREVWWNKFCKEIESDYKLDNVSAIQTPDWNIIKQHIKKYNIPENLSSIVIIYNALQEMSCPEFLFGDNDDIETMADIKDINLAIADGILCNLEEVSMDSETMEEWVESYIDCCLNFCSKL